VRRRTFLGLPGLALALAACGGGPTAVTRRARGTGQVRYGDDPSQYAELTLPDGTPRGVVVVIHGGFWKAQYGIEYARPLVPSLVEAGWAAWAIEYRRVGPAGSGGGGGTPGTFDDVARAIDTLRHQDLDLSTVIALGHSAGGHLATWAAGRESAAVPITAVVSQAGVLDLVAAAKEHLGSDAVLALLGHEPGPTDAQWDPRQQVPLDVPVHCVHATGDDIVPIDQSESYVRAAKEAGADAALTQVDGDHFVLIDPTSSAWQTQLGILDSLG
jgi:acetyl esterase/lipase